MTNSLQASSQPNTLSHPKYRADIDGLRAIAVISVVGFHASPNLIRGGFIGVDIFFVISGFLISTIILENLKRNSFSFIEFYCRRIKRIFPALIVVLLSSLAFAGFSLWILDSSLTYDKIEAIGKHTLAGAGFVSNLVLWNESNYFDLDANLKPLQHLWSLGVEEQFYIVWPLLLWLLWKAKLNVLIFTLIIIMISFVLNVVTTSNNQAAAFYSPLTRFWELLLIFP